MAWRLSLKGDVSSMCGSESRYELMYLGYSRYVVQDTLPPHPYTGDIVYIPTSKTLLSYSGSDWNEVDYSSLIQQTNDYTRGYVRFSEGQLQVTPNGQDWYDCYPALGNRYLRIQTFDNINFQYIYYILPGQMVVLENCNHIPLALTRLICYHVEILSEPPTQNAMIYISDISSSVYFANAFRGDTTFSYNFGIVDGLYFGWGQNYNFASFSVYIDNGQCFSVGNTKYYGNTHGAVMYSNNMNLPSNAWWFGTVRNSDSDLLNNPFICIQRI